MATPDKAAFLLKYTIAEEEFEKSQLNWSVLCEIRRHYVSRRVDLQNVANSISETLQQVPSIHSLRVRVKDPDHLIEKIIRKQLEHVERPDDRLTYADCTPETYDSRITDLVGIRALHLFKDQWRDIHDFIERTWDRHESPVAYIREGDDTKLFQAVGCDIQPHKAHYRSVHYLIKSNPTKRIYLAELQVRTIFEEAWAEIDHSVRYPRQSDDELLAAFLLTFSHVVGFADGLGSFTKRLSYYLRNKAAEVAAAREDVQKKLSEITMGQEERAQLAEKIEQLERAVAPPKTSPALAPIPGAAQLYASWLGGAVDPIVMPIDACKVQNSIAAAIAALNLPVINASAAFAQTFSINESVAAAIAAMNSPAITASDAIARAIEGIPESQMGNSPRTMGKGDPSATGPAPADVAAVVQAEAQQEEPQEHTTKSKEPKCPSCGKTLTRQSDGGFPPRCQECDEKFGS